MFSSSFAVPLCFFNHWNKYVKRGTRAYPFSSKIEPTAITVSVSNGFTTLTSKEDSLTYESRNKTIP
ncbi:UNVERIFIED_CONTAM: hypothetical protein ABID98_003363 [Brevibacillus sp. OAP136]